MDAFYALAAPRRRKIVELLAANGELTATAISRQFEVTAQAISQHLRILLDAKVLLMRKNAQERIYALNPASIVDIERWASRTKTMWSNRLDSIGSILEEEQRHQDDVKKW